MRARAAHERKSSTPKRTTKDCQRTVWDAEKSAGRWTPIQKSETTRTRFTSSIAANPRRSPARRRFQGAGNANTAAAKRSTVSSPLQPFSIRTANEGDRISVPDTAAGSPSALRIAPETRAIAEVKGTTAVRSTGRTATAT
ncbi:MAG TPA: hypothetical protein VIA45_08965 [Thermoanaerobaculia bacterium]